MATTSCWQKDKIADWSILEIVDAYSKVILDVSALVWNPQWVKTNIVHSPIITDQVTFSIDQSRHFMREATSLNRDKIFADLIKKKQKSINNKGEKNVHEI